MNKQTETLHTFPADRRDEYEHALPEIGRLAKSTYWSPVRIMLDLLLWVAAATVAHIANQSALTVLAILFIGAIPMHDLMVHGHEGVHRMISRRHWLNESLNWFTHACVGLSGSAYRAFHLEHHKKVHKADDPEDEVVRLVHKNAPGWVYLLVPYVAVFFINAYPLTHKSAHANKATVACDLMLAALLHCFVALLVGVKLYALFFLAPLLSSLALTNGLRSICEHHYTVRGDRWLETRGLRTSKLVEWLWSNVNYHLEHHLFPFVPYHELPRVRELVQSKYVTVGADLSASYVVTSLRLLCQPKRFKTSVDDATYLVDTTTMSFRMKVLWFKDILVNPSARRHLWSLYYTGEAYVELHPDGVFIPKLEQPVAALLDRHLKDETRHATIFRSFLRSEGSQPIRVTEEEDLGWFLLNHLVPDIVKVARANRLFSDTEAMRYMAFLHTLELRSVSDLYALLLAARQLNLGRIVSGLESILPDEVFHARYTHWATVRFAKDISEARQTLNLMRKAERKYYVKSIKAMSQTLLSAAAQSQVKLDTVRWRVMKLFCNFEFAFAELPLYERVPAAIARGEDLLRRRDNGSGFPASGLSVPTAIGI